MGAFVVGASTVSAVTQSGWIALAAFAIGMTVIGGTAIALIPAWLNFDFRTLCSEG
jgi:ABC-type uncharacterized transport system permease subunit